MTDASALDHDWFPYPLPANVSLGERSWCYSAFSCLHYQSRKGIRVGHDTGIYHGTFFDLGPEGEVDIGNFCTLVGAIFASNRKIMVGDYTFIAHEVVLADSCMATPPAPGRPSTFPQSQTNRGPEQDYSIYIEPNCWIGARAVLLAGTHLGRGSVVGAGAVVNCQVPPYSVVAGNPARTIRSLQPEQSCR